MKIKSSFSGIKPITFPHHSLKSVDYKCFLSVLIFILSKTSGQILMRTDVHAHGASGGDYRGCCRDASILEWLPRQYTYRQKNNPTNIVINTDKTCRTMRQTWAKIGHRLSKYNIQNIRKKFNPSGIETRFYILRNSSTSGYDQQYFPQFRWIFKNWENIY